MRDRTTTAVILPVAVESSMQFGVVHDGFEGTGDLTEAVHLFGALLIAGVGGAAAEGGEFGVVFDRVCVVELIVIGFVREVFARGDSVHNDVGCFG